MPKLMLPPPQDHNAHPTYRPDIDGLRAIAILSVVVFHAFPNVLRGGFVGVDIFFVISGFLISSIVFRSLQRGDFNFAEFYAHRIKRIFPALIVVLIASYAFGWFALLPDEFKQLGKHIAAGAGFVQNFVLWKEAGYFDTASELKPLLHLWSLAIEEQFYLIFPLLIWGAWRLGFNVLTVIGALGIISFGLNIADIEKDVIKTFFMPQTRFWELLVGSLLAYWQLFKRVQFAEGLKRAIFHSIIFPYLPLTIRRGEVLNTLLSIGGFLLIFAAIWGLHKGKLFPGWWALAPVMGAFLLILAGANSWVNRKILANRFMVFIGIISYPLYLWHWSLLSFARIIEEGIPSRGIRIAAVMLSFLFAWLTYRLVEKPLRFGRKTWVKTATLCVLIAVMGFVGYNAFKRDGLAFRHNKEQFDWGANIINTRCRQTYPNFKGDFCVQAKVGEPTIFILGDSHGNHLYPGLAEVTAETTDNVLSLAGGGCLPFFGVTYSQKNRQEKCTAQADYAMQFAEESVSVQTVVISIKGPLYLLDKAFGHLAFQAAIRLTLKKLLTKKKQVVFVLNVPELHFDPKSCISTRPLYLTHHKIRQPCAVSRQDFEATNREYRELVSAVLKDFPSVQLFDAAAQLCDEQWCWAKKDGRMLYRDDNHLSIQGSRLIAQELVKLLQTKPLLAK